MKFTNVKHNVLVGTRNNNRPEFNGTKIRITNSCGESFQFDVLCDTSPNIYQFVEICKMYPNRYLHSNETFKNKTTGLYFIKKKNFIKVKTYLLSYLKQFIYLLLSLSVYKCFWNNYFRL